MCDYLAALLRKKINAAIDDACCATRSRPTADVRHGSSSSSSASWQRKALVGAVAAAVVLLGGGVVMPSAGRV
jgi:hypothetical protein